MGVWTILCPLRREKKREKPGFMLAPGRVRGSATASLTREVEAD